MHRMLFLCTLAGCGWNTLPAPNTHLLDRPLWDPDGIVTTRDGLYVPLPHSGGVALVAPGRESVLVDIGEGRVSELFPVPGGDRVIAIVKRYRCAEEDPRISRRIETPEECDKDDLEIITELGILEDGLMTATAQVNGQVNTIAYSADGRFATAYLDLERPYDTLTGVVDLTSVLVVDLETGASHPTQVGFNASTVLYVYGESEEAIQAVVLSQNSVALLDLTVSPPARDVRFALTLDPDQEVTPIGIDLTPDGEFALISVAERSELYALDLVDPSVRIVEISGTPRDMAVDRTTDKTLLVSSTNRVDIVQHEFLDVSSLVLDEPMTDIEAGNAAAVLWSRDGRKDVYFLDLETEDLTEFRLQQPPLSVHLAPGDDVAIGLTEAGFGEGLAELPGMEILDLRTGRVQQFALQGAGLQVAFDADETSLNALVLQEGVRYLYTLEVYSGVGQEIDLAAPPASIGSLPDGGFFITHTVGSGLISFLDPDSGALVEVADFGLLGLTDTVTLIDTEED